MRRLLLPLLICAALLTRLPAQQAAPNLQAQAEAAEGKKRAQLFMELAAQGVDEASRLFADGKMEAAHAAVTKAVADAEQASDAARKSHKRLKQTEISVRQLARRLTEVGAGLPFEDRETLKASLQKLEEIRRQLLEEMFGKKKKVEP